MKSLKEGAKIYSKATIILIAFTWLYFFNQEKKWQKNLIGGDVICYYGYLPAFFIYDDITLKFTDTNPQFFGKYYWPEKSPNGGRLIKTSMGLSFMYAPFFLIGHFTAPAFNQPQDGFSWPYQFWLLSGCILYLIIGMVFLRKALLFYFTDGITALVLISIYFGTNLFWYSLYDGLLSHGFLFSLSCAYLYLIIKWHKSQTYTLSALLGLIIGLATLTRPTMIIWMLSPFLYQVTSLSSFIIKVKWLMSKWNYLLAFIIFFILIGLPQLFYWKTITGQWFYFSYTGERFYFNQPHIFEVLFSFRKGWLLYIPMMSFSLIGFFLLYKRARDIFWAVLLPFIISAYVLSCWWSWWFGASYGYRPFIEFYPFLSFPIAALFSFVYEKKELVKNSFSILIVLLLTHSLFQTWQFYKGFIHWDYMTKESYMINFLKMDIVPDWWESLKEPDNDRAYQGLPEDYSMEEIKNIKDTDYFNLKAAFYKYLCSEIGTDGEITASRDKPREWEAFRITWLADGKVAFRNRNNKFWSCDPDRDYRVFADKDTIGEREKFILEYNEDSYFILKAYNGKYLCPEKEPPFSVRAKSEKVKLYEKMRIKL